jgi:hypothetical protein
MKKIVCRTIAPGFLVLLILGAGTISHAQISVSSDRKVGEIFVAIGNGQYQVWDFSAAPTVVETITNGGETDNNAGCAFSSTYHPFTTDVTANSVFMDTIIDPQAPIETLSVLPAKGAQPTSVAFDSAGNSYVGVAGGNGLIEEYGPNGAFVKTLPVNTSKLKGGSTWIDLSTDAKTIYFTNGTGTITQSSVSSSKTSRFASISGATLYGLRVLPTTAQAATGGLLLVAAVFSGSSNIQLLNSSGTAIMTYSVTGENNFQVLTLDPNGTSFWAGNPTTHNFYRLNFAGGTPKGPFSTGAGGPSGLCAYGAFSAAQPQPITVTAALTPTSSFCTVNSTTNTMNCAFSTVVPPPSPPSPTACSITVTTEPTTSNCFNITVNGINLNQGHAPNGLQFTYNYSQIAQAAGTSDTVTESSGPVTLACDLSSPDGTKCEVHSIDLNPENAPGQTNIYASFDLAFFSTQGIAQGILNPRVVRDGDLDVTDFVIKDFKAGGSGNSVFTINELPLQQSATGSQSCGYVSPLINSQYNLGRTIPFKFQAVAAGGNCSTGPFLTNLNPRLVLLQLGGTDAAPHPVSYRLSNGTSCPATGPIPPACYYRLDPTSNTWILNVNTSTLTGGGTTYFGTTFDDANQIPSFSNTASGAPIDTFTLN